MRRVQVVPDGLCLQGVAAVSGAEAGVVEVGQSARGGVGGQVGLEPRYHVSLFLRRAQRRTIYKSRRPVPALRVQYDDVPGAPVVGVVAFSSLAGGRVEVVEVARRPRGTVLVVTNRWLGARLELSPAGAIAVGVLG